MCKELSTLFSFNYLSSFVYVFGCFYELLYVILCTFTYYFYCSVLLCTCTQSYLLLNTFLNFLILLCTLMCLYLHLCAFVLFCILLKVSLYSFLLFRTLHFLKLLFYTTLSLHIEFCLHKSDIR